MTKNGKSREQKIAAKCSVGRSDLRSGLLLALDEFGR